MIVDSVMERRQLLRPDRDELEAELVEEGKDTVLTGTDLLAAAPGDHSGKDLLVEQGDRRRGRWPPARPRTGPHLDQAPGR